MMGRERKRRMVVVASRDDDSLIALSRARQWQQALGCAVRAIFLTSSDMPPSRAPDADWFQCWAASKAALPIAMRDISVCEVSDLASTLDHVLATPVDLLILPVATDPSTNIARVSLRMAWTKAAAVGVPLLVTRQQVTRARILVVTDGTPRTLPVLRVAFELGERIDASLSYLNALQIPLTSPGGRTGLLGRSVGPRIAHPTACDTMRERDLGSYGRVACGVAARMAKVGLKEHADVLVIGASSSNDLLAEDVIQAAPCSVLMVPCAARPSLRDSLAGKVAP